MIQVTVFKNQDSQYTGFTCLGHAGYADAGEDIVCAAVSALVINTINSIACFTGEKFQTESDEESGLIRVSFNRPPEHDAELYLKSLILGLQGIQNDYGDEYIMLNFKEV